MSRAIFGKGELSSGIPLEKENFPLEFRWKRRTFRWNSAGNTNAFRWKRYFPAFPGTGT